METTADEINQKYGEALELDYRTAVLAALESAIGGEQ